MSQKMPLGEFITKRYDKMDSDRGNWKDYWSALAKFIYPNRDNIYGENTPGQRKNSQVFDGTAIRANRDYANAMVTLLMNPSTKWFNLSTGDPQLDAVDNVHKWLDRSTQRILRVLSQSNFYAVAHEAFLDDGCFGTNAVLVLKDDVDFVRFETQPPFEWVISESHKKVIDLGYRKYKATLRQLVAEFGEDLILGDDNELRREYKECPDKEYEVIQAIEPRNPLAEMYDEVDKGTQNPYVSVHVFCKNKKVLKVGGFSSKPIIISRHSKESGEIWGRSPGMEAYPEVMSLNAMRKAVLIGAQLAIAPPLQASDNSVIRGVKLRPYGITYRRPGSDPIEPLFSGARPDIGQDLIAQSRDEIEKFFYLDQLRTVQSDRMTATEIMQRRDEQFRSLSAVLVRKDLEFCKPIIDRVFNLLFEARVFEPPPEELRQVGGRLAVVYNSMIAKAMQMAEAENFTRAIQVTSPIFEMDPQVSDNIDSDMVLRGTFKQLGVDSSFLRDEGTRDEIREQRAEAQAAQAQQQAQMTEAQTQKDFAQADKLDSGE